MPARRRNSVVQKNRSKKQNYFKYFVYLATILLAIYLYKLLTTTKYFDSKDKVSIAVQKANGDVKLMILDNANKEINSIDIPGSTEVETSRNLGKLRLKNVWKLGNNEGIKGGQLLSETLTYYFKFPNYVWAGEEALSFMGTNPITCLKGLFSTYETNMSYGDKFAVSFFCIKVRNIDRSNIDLSESTFLRKQKLADGEEGYVLTDMPSPKLYSNFALNSMLKNNYRISIIDGSGNNSISKKVGDLMEIMGAKVSSITKSETRKITCSVNSSDVEVNLIISLVLRCKEPSLYSAKQPIEITIGQKFMGLN